MNEKSSRGQFYTTNSHIIFKYFEVPPGRTVIEPFAGAGDLIKNLDNPLELYDISPPNQDLGSEEKIQIRDTLLNPPDYAGKFIITNPPYLAKNKNKCPANKDIYEKYRVDDLYKAFLKTLMLAPLNLEGIIIIPVNFWTSGILTEFMKYFKITLSLIFEYPLFTDTTAAVTVFHFVSRVFQNDHFEAIDTVFLQLGGEEVRRAIKFPLFTKLTNYIIPEHIVVARLTKQVANTRINIHCIDNTTQKIRAYLGEPHRDTTPKLSERTVLNLVITIHGRTMVSVNKNAEEVFVKRFNNYLAAKREKYNSMFLTNYRETNRKRISFEQVFKIAAIVLAGMIKYKK